MKIRFSLYWLCTLLAIFPVAVYGQVSYDHWDFRVKGQNTLITDSLATLGIRPDATAGFDNVYDIPRPPRVPSGDYVEVYFPHSGGNFPPVLGTKYAVDFQGTSNPMWNMSVEASISGPITLLWDSSYVNSLEPRVQLYLQDLTNGTSINMRNRGSYSFVYSTKRNFQILGAVSPYTITASAGPNGSISPLGAVSIFYGKDTTFTFTPNDGYHIDSVIVNGSYRGTMPSYTLTNVRGDSSIRVAFAPNSYQVTVQTNPAGLSITVDGTPYTAPHVFTWTFASNHTITTGSIQAGSTGTQFVWSNWSDGKSILHTVTPVSDSMFLATFGTQYFLTMGASGSGTVAPLSGWLNSGQVVSLTATPALNHHFVSWIGTGNGSYAGAVSSSSVTMNGPIMEIASFAIDQVEITVQAVPSGCSFEYDGVPYTSPQTRMVDIGSLHTISTTTPQSGGTGVEHLWHDWTDGGLISHTITPTANTIYTANFTTRYFLTMISGGGGSVTPSNNWYNAGQSVQIEGTADPGYSFGGWNGTGTGSYSGVNNPASITMNGPITETASFTIVPVQVLVQTSPDGRSFGVDGVIYATSQSFNWNQGSSHTISVSSPQSVGGTRFVFSNWSDAGTQAHTITPMVNGTYTATFTTQYQLTMNGGAGGIVSPPSGWYSSGQTVDISATVNTGNHFTSWSGSGSGSYTGTNNPATVTMNGPVSETAGFAINTFSITASAGPNGSILPLGPVIVEYGRDTTFTITPNPGFHVSDVSVDGSSVGAVTSYTFTNVMTDHTISAQFEVTVIYHSIIASAGAHGTISPSGTVSLPEGDSQLFTFVADPGYEFDSLVVDGVVLSAAPSYTFNNVIVDHTIRITFVDVALAIRVNDGWNMLSLPRWSPNRLKSNRFPAAASAAFSYDGGYVPKDTLEYGMGVWLKFSGRQYISLDGHSMNTCSISLRQGWNMIGSVSKAVDVDAIIQNPPGSVSSQYFGYDNIYYLADSIAPGEAFWLKTIRAAVITMQYGAVMEKQSVQQDSRLVLASLNSISFTAPNVPARSQVLYFGSTPDDQTNPDQFSLPPAPPEGSSDVRFASGRFAERITSQIGKVVEMPIVIQSATETMTLDWKIIDNAVYSLVERRDGKVTTTHRMTGSGKTELHLREGSSWSLRLESIPQEFSLSQNFPNPFNPTTVVQFALPQNALVSFSVYNVLGQEVAAVLSGVKMEAGVQEIEFTADHLASGIYYYRLVAVPITDTPADPYFAVKPMMLLK